MVLADFTSTVFSSRIYSLSLSFFSFFPQYGEPLVFWPPFQLNFQNGPEIIFSCLACHSRPSICSFQSLFSFIFQYTFHLSYLSHIKVRPLLIAICWNLLIFQGSEYLSPFPFFFPEYLLNIPSPFSLRSSKLCYSFLYNICLIIASM